MNTTTVSSLPDHPRRPWRRLAVLAAAGALALAGCGGDDGPATASGDTGAAAPAKAARGGTLRAAILTTPQDSLDASLPAGDNTTQVRNILVYERMATLDRDQRVVPILYTKAEHAADGSTWTFTLDERATFADGSPVTGQDVLDSLAALQQTDAAASLKMVDLKRSTADGKTVTFVLRHPVADMEERLASSYFIVLKDGKGSADAAKMNGSGPYAVKAFRAGQRTELVRRDDYWAGDERGMADRIELIGVADPAARMRALRAGQVDLADDVSFVDARAARERPDTTLHAAPVPVAYELILNSTRPPFDDVRVRQALRLAVDRQALVDSVTAGFGKPGNDLWGADMAGFATGIPQRTQDVEAAKKLLAEAGTPTVKTTIYTSEMTPGLVAGTRLLAEQAKAAGFDLEVEEMTPDRYYGEIQKWGTWPAIAFSMSLSFVQMADYFYLPASPFNFGWDEPGWVDRFNAALGVFDGEERQTQLDGLQRDLWNAGPDLIWGLAPKQIATTPEVVGLDGIADYNYPDLTNVTVR